MKKRRYSTKALSLLLAVMLVLNVFVPAVGAAGTDTNTADRLTPDEMTFRKVWTQRNVFNTELLLDEADLPDGGWTVGGGGDVYEVKEIGTHTPYGMYRAGDGHQRRPSAEKG